MRGSVLARSRRLTGVLGLGLEAAALGHRRLVQGRGARYLQRAFWRTFCEDAACFGFVWLDGARVAGFVAGTTDRDAFIGSVVRRAPIEFMWRLALAAARRPRMIAHAAGLALRLREQRLAGGPGAELISLGVLPRAARPAVAAESAGGQRPVSPALVLIAASAAHLGDRGVASFRLYTGATNHLACAFYRRLGFPEASRFTMFGEDKVGFTGNVFAPAFDTL